MRPRGRRAVLTLLSASTATLAACGPAYREPPSADPSAARPASRGDQGATVVGRVAPDGSVVADTLIGEHPDTTRVERETVYAGAIVEAEPTAVGPPTGGAVEGRRDPDTGELWAAGGPWVVQIFAARDEPAATTVAHRAESDLGAQARVVLEEGFYKVRVGGYASRAEAESIRERLAGSGYPEAFVVRRSDGP